MWGGGAVVGPAFNPPDPDIIQVTGFNSPVAMAPDEK